MLRNYFLILKKKRKYFKINKLINKVDSLCDDMVVEVGVSGMVICWAYTLVWLKILYPVVISKVLSRIDFEFSFTKTICRPGSDLLLLMMAKTIYLFYLKECV